LDSSKLEHTWFNNLPLFDEDKSLVLMLDLIESEAVSARHSLSKAQYFWYRIRIKTVYQSIISEQDKPAEIKRLT